MAEHRVHLLVSCPDAKGLVASMTGFLASQGANILDLDQHTDGEEGWFFARVAFDLSDCTLSLADLKTQWETVASRHRMTWQMHDKADRRRVAVLVSKRDHCLRELLWRWEDGELDCDIPLIISNHAEAERTARRAGLTFHHLPVDRESRDEHERRMLDLFSQHRIDFVVLARYMQVLSPAFVRALPNRIINIHHSFLPAFAGSKPYHQAYACGVKVIGATCHYVTEELDTGPIIEQAVTRTDHRDTLADLIRKGADLERSALVAGVQLHLHDRVLVHGRRTIVFH